MIFQHLSLRLLERNDGKNLKMPLDTQDMLRLTRSIHVLQKIMGKKTQCRSCFGFALLFSWESFLCKKLEVKWSLVKSYVHSSIVQGWSYPQASHKLAQLLYQCHQPPIHRFRGDEGRGVERRFLQRTFRYPHKETLEALWHSRILPLRENYLPRFYLPRCR